MDKIPKGFYLTSFCEFICGGKQFAGGLWFPKRFNSITAIIWFHVIPVAYRIDCYIINLAKRMGCYWFYNESQFKFGNKTIKCPKEFSSGETREIFNRICNELVSPINSRGQKTEMEYRDPVTDAMIHFRKKSITRMPDDKQIEIVKRIINFLVSEGVLVEYWQLWIPCHYPGRCRDKDYTDLRIPNWDNNGQASTASGLLLTVSQKTATLGIDYATLELFLRSGEWDSLTFPPTKKTSTEKDGVIYIDEVPDYEVAQTPEEELERRRKIPKHKITEKDFLPIYVRQFTPV